MATYDVLTQPWINVRDATGREVELGMLDTLESAHDLIEIVDPSPPIRFGIYRLLTVFVMDAFGVSSLEDIQDLLVPGKLDVTRLRAYATECGQCFDLFDGSRPFLQSASTSGERKPAAVLMQHTPSGTFPTHFHRVGEDANAFSPAVCARALCAVSPFMTAGGAGFSPSINGNPPWYVLVCGSNLFETLLLNACGMPLPIPRDKDYPAWRNPNPVSSDEVARVSMLEGLTWRPRSILLIPGEGGKCTYCGADSPMLVRQVHFSPGMQSPKNGALWQDYQSGYRITEKGPFPLRPSEDHELWRDRGPLMLLHQKDYQRADGKVSFERPSVVTQYAHLQLLGAVPKDRPLEIECFGIRTDGKMKIFEWQQERLALPAALLNRPGAGRIVQEAMDLADLVGYFLKKSIKTAYPREGSGNSKAFDSLVVSAQTQFWSLLRLRFDQEFLLPLTASDPTDGEALKALQGSWLMVLKQEAIAAIELVLDDLDADAHSLRRQVQARDRFWSSFAKLSSDGRPALKKSKSQNTPDKETKS